MPPIGVLETCSQKPRVRVQRQPPNTRNTVQATAAVSLLLLLVRNTPPLSHGGLLSILYTRRVCTVIAPQFGVSSLSQDLVER